MLWAVVLLAALLTACFPDRKEIRENTWIAVSLKPSATDSTWNPGAVYELTFPEKRTFSIRLDVNSCGGIAAFNPNNIIFLMISVVQRLAVIVLLQPKCCVY